MLISRVLGIWYLVLGIKKERHVPSTEYQVLQIFRTSGTR